MERVKGIEPSQPAWKAGALPLSYTRIWWRKLDLNQRRIDQQIYSLPPLTTRAFLQYINCLNGAGDRNRTYNLLITSQLLCQLSHASILRLTIFLILYLKIFLGDPDGARTHDLQRDRLAF